MLEIDSCTLCPRMCRVPRAGELPGRGKGMCKMGANPVVARAALHHWEEPCISGQRGSGTVFFSGCALGCMYCQNEQISRECFGKALRMDALVQAIQSLEAQGAHNINLVTAAHFAHAVQAAFSVYRPGIPVLYNSSGYERVQTLARLQGMVDIYLPDIKYKDAALSRRYSHAEDYFAHAAPAVLEMARQVGAPVYDAQGVMQRGLVVRHLVLPAMTQDSIEILRFIAAELPKGTPISLMGQYMPVGQARQDKFINRGLTRREYDKVADAMVALGLTHGYMQQRSSADAAFIPPFNLEGV